MDPIMNRRSIRKYAMDPIPNYTVDSILDAAEAAPCAHGRRSWQFIVIDDRSILDKVPEYHPYSKMILQAPLAILVCGDTSIEPDPGYWTQNCSAATQNILLSATSHGLGSVWLGIYPMNERVDALRELVSVPEDIIPFSLVVIGKPLETKEPHSDHDRSKVHKNHW